MDVLKEDVKLVLVVVGEEDADCDDVWKERIRRSSLNSVTFFWCGLQPSTICGLFLIMATWEKGAT